MAFDFTRKTVLITGASGNLGSAVVRGFAANGANVALVDLNQERMEAVISSLSTTSPLLKAEGSGERFRAFVGDLSAPDKVEALVNDIATQFGQIDILAHTVGGYAAGQPVHETGLDVLDKMLALNVRPVYLIGGAVAKHMVEKSVTGKIVFVLAKAGAKGGKNSAAYTASKAAATRIMESMSAELRDFNINVNGVSPSTIDTPANREAMPNADASKWVTPDQLADAIMFLASEQSTAIHGTNLEVYGRS